MISKLMAKTGWFGYAPLYYTICIEAFFSRYWPLMFWLVVVFVLGGLLLPF